MTQRDRAGVIAPTEEAFAAASRRARLNFRDALDLILVHAEKPVRGEQPRTALNPAIAVAAVGAWEGFVNDLVGACTPSKSSSDDDPPPSAHLQGMYWQSGLHYPDRAERELWKLGYLADDRLIDRWLADVPDGYAGSRPTNWQRRQRSTDDRWGVDDYLRSAILVRHAGAHHGMVALPLHAQKKTLPYMTGDAKSPTLQNGYARGVAALVLQVLDSTIAAISADRGWSDAHRLPSSWFAKGPHDTGRYEGMDFWGRELPRV